MAYMPIPAACAQVTGAFKPKMCTVPDCSYAKFASLTAPSQQAGQEQVLYSH